MVQEIIVGFIVLAAACYAGWRFMPSSLRNELAHALGARGRRLGLSDTHAQKLTQKLESSGGCGSCGSRKACGKAGDDMQR